MEVPVRRLESEAVALDLHTRRQSISYCKSFVLVSNEHLTLREWVLGKIARYFVSKLQKNYKYQVAGKIKTLCIIVFLQTTKEVFAFLPVDHHST